MIHNSSIFLKSYFYSGYKFVKDLVDVESDFKSLKLLRNSNVNAIGLDYIVLKLKEAVLKRIKTSKKNKVKYWPFIPNYIYMYVFYKQSKGYKNIHCKLINYKKRNKLVNWKVDIYCMSVLGNILG